MHKSETPSIEQFAYNSVSAVCGCERHSSLLSDSGAIVRLVRVDRRSADTSSPVTSSYGETSRSRLQR